MLLNHAPARPVTVAGPDSGWKGLYRAGGVAALATTLAYVVALGLDFTVPPAPVAGGAATLDYIAAHRSVYILEQILWQAPGIPLMITFLALYVALRDVNRNYAVIGGVLAVSSWALTLVYPATGGGAPSLVYLSDQYIATTDAARRAALAAAAEGFIAQNVTPTLVGILGPVGILLAAVLMLQGVFSRPVAYLSLATGVLGTVSEALRPLLGPAYGIYGLLLFVWLAMIGWQFYRLGTDRRGGLTGDPAAEREVLRAAKKAEGAG